MGGFLRRVLRIDKLLKELRGLNRRIDELEHVISEQNLIIEKLIIDQQRFGRVDEEDSTHVEGTA